MQTPCSLLALLPHCSLLLLLPHLPHLCWCLLRRRRLPVLQQPLQRLYRRRLPCCRLPCQLSQQRLQVSFLHLGLSARSTAQQRHSSIRIPQLAVQRGLGHPAAHTELVCGGWQRVACVYHTSSPDPAIPPAPVPACVHVLGGGGAETRSFLQGGTQCVQVQTPSTRRSPTDLTEAPHPSKLHSKQAAHLSATHLPPS